MRKHDLSKSLLSVNFYCSSCRANFESEPDSVVNCPEIDYHPFRYVGICPSCGEECDLAPFQKGLIKAWANATGPRTSAGKAAVTKNLEGHPTAEEALRTRFNAMKHGLNAEVATYFPAKPDGYPACVHCDVDRSFCANQAACVKQTELFLLHHAAFEQRDPKHLTSIYASIQSAVTAVIQQILQTIVKDGVTLTAPAWKIDREGNVVIGEYIDQASRELKTIYEVKAHPLLKPLSEFLTRNNMSLSDMGMSPKAIEQQEEAMGKLAVDKESEQILLDDFAQRTNEAMAGLKELATKALANKEKDPILLEYQQQNGDHS